MVRPILTFVLLLGLTGSLLAWTPVVVKDDPLVRMPGTQPPTENSVTLEDPGRCLNCHQGYDTTAPYIDPGTNWQGSMMAQAARDPLFWACLTVAAQDSIAAVGTPNATDICLRCHFPKGWLEGRSDPTNASAMTTGDFNGVQCDFCHRSYDPFFDATYDGDREGNDWLNYWDETNASDTPSQTAADSLLTIDAADAATIKHMNGDAFFGGDNRPVNGNYTAAGAGQYFVSADNGKRASFADATARHQFHYSRFHKSKFFCATCHDVSNPALANLGADPANPLPTELNAAHSYFHVERTFSEFMLSDFGLQGGASGEGPYDPLLFTTSHPDNKIATCQDCHMTDQIGKGADKADAVLRPTDSVEHPNSGQPVHTQNGGNIWVSEIIASAISGSPNYDATNDGLLNQDPSILTMDLSAGIGVDPDALLLGADRARANLQNAAAITDIGYNPATGYLTFRIKNYTGHKLISGFPEGRRMFVSIEAYNSDSLIYTVNPYDTAACTLKGLDYAYQPDVDVPDPVALDPLTEEHVDELVYEMKPTSSLTGEDKTFHFALATDRYKDNRIPPKGFRIAESSDRLCQPRDHNADAADMYTADEYLGGYDEVGIELPTGADEVHVRLYYQTTSREYVEFLRDEINGTVQTLDPEDYIIQTDPFFDQLRAWGDTIWSLWKHNRTDDGAAPFLMTEAEWNDGDPTPTATPSPTPTDTPTATPSATPTASPSPTPIELPGDEDGSGTVVLGELNACILGFRGLGEIPSSADTNTDGVLDLAELNAVVLAYRGSI
ncbi:cytochrome c family protein [bacterium]|nr:cytochrome c family protein [bacterium]